MDIGPKGIGHDNRREEYTRARHLKGDFSKFFAEYESNDKEKKRRPHPAQASREQEDDQVELGAGSSLTVDRALAIYRERMLFELREFLNEATGDGSVPADAATLGAGVSLDMDSVAEDVARYAYRVFGLARCSQSDGDLKMLLFQSIDRGRAQVHAILGGLSARDQLFISIADTDELMRSMLESIPG